MSIGSRLPYEGGNLDKEVMQDLPLAWDKLQKSGIYEEINTFLKTSASEDQEKAMANRIKKVLKDVIRGDFKQKSEFFQRQIHSAFLSQVIDRSVPLNLMTDDMKVRLTKARDLYKLVFPSEEELLC